MGFESAITVEAQGRSGGLIFLWRWEKEYHLLGYSSNHIDVSITRTGEGMWRFKGIYGDPPWCIMGDLSNILHVRDQWGGQPYPRNLFEGFHQTLLECDLSDVELQGCQYTWERGRGGPNWIQMKLDRCLVSTLWRHLFPSAMLHNLEGSSSDHCPVLLEPHVTTPTLQNNQFKFEKTWLKDPMCLQIIKTHWDTREIGDMPQKITMCNKDLAEWGKSITRNFGQHIKQCSEELNRLRSKRDTRLVNTFKEVRAQLFKILDHKESYWKQRAKQFWLREGDCNNKYFHVAASTRKRRNLIC